jgi:hypothetical protein
MKIRKIFLGLLLGLFGLWVHYAVGIHISYSSYLPRTPDEKSGHIYQMTVNHGFIRYGTEREIQALKMVEDFQPIAILSFLLAGVLGMSWGIFKIAPGRKLHE